MGEAGNHSMRCVRVIRNIWLKDLQSFLQISLLFIFKRTIMHIFSSDFVHMTGLMQLIIVLKESICSNISEVFCHRYDASLQPHQ